jgi:hypothetical protein
MPKGVLSPSERAGIESCRAGLTEQLRREMGRCTRCSKIRSRKTEGDLCHACILELGMPHYHRLMASKREQEKAKKRETNGDSETGDVTSEESEESDLFDTELSSLL